MSRRGTESDFELTTIERLEQLNYDYIHGEELERPHEEVVLKDRLKASLQERYSNLPANTIEEAVNRFARPEGVDTLRRNLAFHRDLTDGVDIKVKQPDGKEEYQHIYAIDWEHPKKNEFLVVNQFSISGKNDRRPDIVIFINGLPLVVFELKNPYNMHPTVEDAYNQIQHYKNDIPQLFEFNAIAIISDGNTTLHGMWTASDEWFAPWKSIDGFNIEADTTGSMKTLVEGLLSKDRLLQYIKHFILFEVASDVIAKKGAKYHQFFAVRVAADKTIETMLADKDKRIGVIWHTTGSGKSLSMVFLVAILRRRLEMANPTFVIEVDRNDLDDQLHDQFNAARALVGEVKHADSVDDLRKLLQTEGGEVIMTTIEKFQLKEEEIEHPILSERSNVVIIADEAHRSQYGFLKGYARYLADALPNAKRIGFTGTPISLSGADTVEVFGDLIHVYDIKQSQEDKATVPIWYQPHLIKLDISEDEETLESALQVITGDDEVDRLEERKRTWAALAAAAGAKERVRDLASALLRHYLDREANLKGKALVVCMTRVNCVRVYKALTSLSDCPETAIVMTGNLSEDPPEWSEKGYITTKKGREAIKKRMVDPDDPLKITIVCDMWLTGTDIPCLHTLYVDKPMRGHNIIQAISRVNRVFQDKPHGLIVDFIGIGDQLREATSKYAQGGGKGEPAPDISEKAKPEFFKALEEVRGLLPKGHDYGAWRKLSRIEQEDLGNAVFGYLADYDARREHFLQAEARLSVTFLLVKHLDDCRIHADEIIFYQNTRHQLMKALPGKKPKRDLEHAVRDLVDRTIKSEGVFDIFKLAGIEKVDISILDDDFLQTFKNKPHQNLRLKMLEKIMRDEIGRRQKKNLTQAKSFKKLLDETLEKYHKRIIDAAMVIETMVQIRKDMDNQDQRIHELGLKNDEELAFYDAVAKNYENLYGVEFLSGLIQDVVQTIKGNLKVDWTEPHRDDVKAGVRTAVKRVLRKRKVKTTDFDPFIESFLEQSEALYKDWPVAA